MTTPRLSALLDGFRGRLRWFGGVLVLAIAAGRWLASDWGSEGLCPCDIWVI